MQARQSHETWGARFGALVLPQEYRSVGMARRAGVRGLLSLWPEEDPARIWLATTDADSRVPQDWLAVQLDAYLSGADMWAGRVRVAEESAAALRWTQRYSAERDPVHGASLGFSADLVHAAWRLRRHAHWGRSRSPPQSHDGGLSDRL